MNAPIDNKYWAAVEKAGGKRPTGPRDNSEERFQIQVIAAIEAQYPDVYVMASPNAGKRSRRAQMINKRTGVKAGDPDLRLLFADGGHGYIELKRPDRKIVPSSLSETQRGFRDICQARGIPWAVCNSIKDVLDHVEQWH